MSLTARERRRLTGIQDVLDHSDPGLVSLFTIFSRLAQEEEMPHMERLRVRADRLAAQGKKVRTALVSRLQVILITPVALIAAAAALLIGGWSGGQGACKATTSASQSSHRRVPALPLSPLCQPGLLRQAIVGR
ncbi:MAG: hypothetical protein ACM3ML_16205 [Micromonosporaceae bacterium]